MHPAEIEAALESMMVLVDTREQETPALRARLRQVGKYEREKLDAGDYSAKILINSNWVCLNVAVERKMDFDELANCYCRQRKRFTAEFERAKRAGTKIYLLIEEASWEDAYSGAYHSKMKPQSLVASILTWLARYDCQILFCSRRTSGKLIHDILFREAREALMRMVDDEI